MKRRTGRHILIEALLAQGVKTVYCGPEDPAAGLCAEARGSSLQVAACSQGDAAGFMAEAAGRLTGKPGVCLVAHGAGVSGAAAAVQAAMESSSPLVLLIEQADGPQEVDYRLMFGAPVSKWVLQANNATDIPRVLRQAIEASITGRAGPVVVTLAATALGEEAEYAALPPLTPVHFGPRHNDLERLARLLAVAKKPVVITGGGGWTADAIDGFAAFCARASLPVITGFGRQDVFPNDHGGYAGSLGPGADPQALSAIVEADLVIAVGTRLGSLTTQGYTLLESPEPKQPLVHIYPDSTELNRVYKAVLAIHSDIPAFVRALEHQPLQEAGTQGWVEDLRTRYLASSDLPTGTRKAVIEALPPGATIITDGRNDDDWPGRYICCHRPSRFIAALGENAGYGLPAALAAGGLFPDRAVICFIGAESFAKAAASLDIARQEGRTVVFLVSNLADPKIDAEALARLHGIGAVTVSREEDLPGRLKKALLAGAATVIDIRAALK